MFKISRLADYGIVLLTGIARKPLETTYTARDLAETSRLPLPMVSKVLKLLAREGVLASHRGVKGGYSLARHPGEISVADIIHALEGPIALTNCVEHAPGCCGFESGCTVRVHWELINAAVVGSLQAITLEEMANPLSAKLKRAGQNVPQPGNGRASSGRLPANN